MSEANKIDSGKVFKKPPMKSQKSRLFRDKSNSSTSQVNGIFNMQTGIGIIKGPVLAQTSFMYAFFILVNGSAQVLEWAPNIRIVAFLPYAVVCFVLVELSRLVGIFFPKMEVILPFYSTLLPFALVCFWSREAHIQVTALFFCSCMIIYLQSGHSALQMHTMAYVLLFLLVYAAVIMAMLQYYIDPTGVDFFYGRKLDPPISWGQEVTFILCLGLLGVGFLLLERFIKLYATNLSDRSKKIQTLEIEKEELVQEIKKYKDDRVDIDLDAPLQKVITTLQGISGDLGINSAIKDQLSFVIKILASNKLYAPNLEDKPSIDTEVSSWLRDMLNTTSEQTKDEKRTNTIVVDKTSNNVTRFLPVLDENVEKQVHALLETIEDWNFDVFKLAELTGRPLFFTTYALFVRHDLFKKFSVSEAKFRRFLTIIEDGYDSRNPYHNSIHAADVVQTLNYFISKGGLSKYITELDIFACIIAALIHDYGHPGLNNAYQISIQSELAVRYNDKSVLENYHTAEAFSLLYQEQNNIFSGLTENQKKDIRETIVTVVLATDMAHHFDLLGKFKAKFTGNGLDSNDRKDRLLLMQIGIKCSDISNPTKLPSLCQKWAARVMEEFYRQGDEERRQEMPVSAFMDRTKPAEAKCQVGFIDFIVSPLFDVWGSFLPEMRMTMENLEANRTFWKKKQEYEIMKPKSSLDSIILDNHGNSKDES